MSECGDPGEPEKSRGSFDGVKGPEHRVDGFLVVGRLLELQQRGFGVDHALVAFRQEVGEQFTIGVVRQHIEAGIVGAHADVLWRHGHDGRGRHDHPRGCRRASFAGAHGPLERFTDLGKRGRDIGGRPVHDGTEHARGARHEGLGLIGHTILEREIHQPLAQDREVSGVGGLQLHQQRRGIIEIQRGHRRTVGSRHAVPTRAPVSPQSIGWLCREVDCGSAIAIVMPPPPYCHCAINENGPYR